MKRFRVHMTDHDILEEQEAAMALTFLTRRERRDLWGVVEERRETFLKTGRHLFNTSQLGDIKEYHEEDKSGEEEDRGTERQFGTDMTSDTVKKSDRITRLKDTIERVRVRLNYDRETNIQKEKCEKSDTIIRLEGSIQRARIESNAEKKIPKYVDTIDNSNKLGYIEDDLFEAKSDKESNPVVITYENSLEIYKLIPGGENEIDSTNKDEPIPSLVGEDATEEIELKEQTIVLQPTLVKCESVPSMCELCYMTMDDKIALEDHVNKIHIIDKGALERSIRLEDLTYGCLICPLKFLSQNILDTHTNLQHKMLSKMENLCCKLCSVSFKSHGMFKRHKLYLHEGHKEEVEAFKRDIHSAELVHQCDVCESRFLTKNILSYHKRKSIHLTCILCHTVYKDRMTFKTHVLRHHKSEYEASIIKQGEVDNIPMSLKCNQCGKNMLTAAILSYHTRSVHKEKVNKKILRNDAITALGTNNLTCSLCHVTFKDAKIQRIHIRNSHTSQDEIRALDSGYYDKEKLIISCQQCDLKFPTKVISEFHQKYGHRTDENWQCQYCKKTFPKNKKRGKIFKLHIRKRHSVTDYGEESRPEGEAYRNFNLMMGLLNGRKL